MNNGNGSRRPPAHLSRATKKWWAAVADRYELEEHHYRLLEMAATSWDRAEEARALVKRHGLTCEGRFGVKLRPEVMVEEKNKLIFARLLRELNLSETPDDPRPPRLGYGGKQCRP
jgi:phage terminase small subunit